MKKKEEIIDSIIIDGMQILKNLTSKGTIELIFLPRLGMNGKDFFRWKIHHNEQIKNFKNKDHG